MITLFCIHPHGLNVGNDVIHIALRAMLDRAFGRIVNIISVPATARFEIHRRAGLTASMIHEINQYADGVIIGGGNLYENGQLDVDLAALPALEPPMLLFSLSRGRVYNRRSILVDRTDAMPDATVQALHDRATASIARDRATFQYLQDIGCPHVELGGCPTIELGSIAHTLADVPERDRDAVLLSIRNPALMNIPLAAQAEVRTTIESIALEVRSRTGQLPKLLCHDHRDIPFAASFPGLEFIYTGDAFRFLALLRAARLNITFRLHSALPCLSFGTPFVNITYDERAQSAIDTVGLGTWNIDLMDCSVLDAVRARLAAIDTLPDIVTQTADARSKLSAVMGRSIAQFRDAVHQYAGQPISEVATCSKKLAIST